MLAIDRVLDDPSALCRQLGVQAAGIAIAFTFVFVTSYLTFGVLEAAIELRVSDEEEVHGLDIVEHGMYGYPEQFIYAQNLELSDVPVEGP